MVFDSDSDLMMLAARVTFLLVISAILLVLVVIVAMRLKIALTERANDRLIERWRPLFIQCVAGMEVFPPRLSRAEVVPVLYLWNHFREILKGDATTRLNLFGTQAGLKRAAAKLLQKGNIKNQLLAIKTLGHMHDKDEWKKLREMTVSSHPVLSLAAARAMIVIDPEEAVNFIIPVVIRRATWPGAIVSTILRQMGPDIVSKPLADAVYRAAPNDMPRVIRYLETAHYGVIRPTVHKILASTKNDEVVSACLQVIKDPDDLHVIRAYMNHPSWFIRLQVAKTLGKVGTWPDMDRLIGLLKDQSWWVRYRAAQSLTEMPFIEKGKLKQIMNEQSDRYARGILSQVLVEKGLV